MKTRSDLGWCSFSISGPCLGEPGFPRFWALYVSLSFHLSQCRSGPQMSLQKTWNTQRVTAWPRAIGTHHTRTWVNFPHIDKKLLNPSSEINNRACLLDAYIWTQKGSQKGSPQAQDSSVWLLAALSRDRWCASAVDLYTGREARVCFDRTAENNYSLCLSIPPSLPSSQSWWRVGCNTVSSSERQ